MYDLALEVKKQMTTRKEVRPILLIVLDYVPVEKWALEIQTLIEEALASRAYDSTVEPMPEEYAAAKYLVEIAGEVGAAFTSKRSKLLGIREKLAPMFRDEFDRMTGVLAE